MLVRFSRNPISSYGVFAIASAAVGGGTPELNAVWVIGFAIWLTHSDYWLILNLRVRVCPFM